MRLPSAALLTLGGFGALCFFGAARSPAAPATSAQTRREAGSTQLAGEAPARRAPRRLPGMQAGGSVLLPTQWSLRPAGDQVALGDFPVNVAIHPKGRWAAVLHAGYGDHEIAIVDLDSKRIVSRVGLRQTYYGLCFDPGGRRLFASGAEDDLVHAFSFENGYLSAHRELPV